MKSQAPDSRLHGRDNQLPVRLPWDFGRIPVSASGRAGGFGFPAARALRLFLQPKLVVGALNDPLEYEADHLAERVMSAPAGPVSTAVGRTQLSRKCSCSGEHKCPTCEEDGQKTLQTKPASVSRASGTAAPPVVGRVLGSPGQPLDTATRTFMESRFGHDFSHVRVHTDARASASADAVNALAYTVGSDVVFASGRYAPKTVGGRRLLAHELTHVLQQQDASAQPTLQRFAASEVNRIAPTFQDMLNQIKQLINDATTPNGDLDWNMLVEISGGSSFARKMDEKLGSKDPTIKSRLLLRYLFSCRCGLFDMRHFMQLQYIAGYTTIGGHTAQQVGNRGATNLGREHELTSESESRFGAEDTPSNAMAAATSLELPAIPSPDALFNVISNTLARCDPVDWKTLSKASQDQIIHFYGDLVPDPAPKKAGDKIPKNQNQTAVPDILPIAECGGHERSFPYTLDESDPDRKTISGKAFDKGSASLSSDSDIRDFVNTQRPEVLRALPASEKVRLVERLMKGWVSDDDLDALEVIYKNSNSAEKSQIQAAAPPADLNSTGQRSRLKVIYAQ